jgi:hypothetical protein
MFSDSVRRLSRFAAAGFAAALVVAGLGLGAQAAHAQTTQDISVSLSPTSGVDYGSDTGTLSWTLPSECVASGVNVNAVLYPGTAAWDAAAVNEAEGNAPQSVNYGVFYSPTAAPTAAAGSAAWPDVAAPGYVNDSTGATVASTSAFEAAQGPGVYTLGVACVNATTFAPILDSSGNAVTGSLLVDLSASGAWSVDTAVGTTTALAGSGTSGNLGSSVSLTATVTAADGSAPAGGVNFYAGSSATGTPLNGSTPVPVGSGGTASFSGSSGYGTGNPGDQPFTAVFVPTDASDYTPSQVTSSVPLIFEDATLTVTAVQDPTSATSADVTATLSTSPDSLATVLAGLPGGGVNFVVDGTSVNNTVGGVPAPFFFNSSGVATDVVTGLSAGTHTFTAQLEDLADVTQGPGDGYNVTATTASLTTSPFTAATALTVSAAEDSATLTATVLGPLNTTEVPAGTVTFANGATVLGTATLSGTAGSGEATASVTDPNGDRGGTYDYTATFTPADTTQYATGSTTSLVASTHSGSGVAWTATSPNIIGQPVVPAFLSADTVANWTSGTATFEWFADGKQVETPNEDLLTLTNSLVGDTITVEDTGVLEPIDDVRIDVTGTSSATAPVTG